MSQLCCSLTHLTSFDVVSSLCLPHDFAVFFQLKHFSLYRTTKVFLTFMLILLSLTYRLTVYIFVTLLRKAPFHFNWLASFWQWITWLVWLNCYYVINVIEMLWQLAIISNSKIACSAFSKQNVLAKTAGGLKHFSTLEIWSSLLAPEFVY